MKTMLYNVTERIFETVVMLILLILTVNGFLVLTNIVYKFSFIISIYDKFYIILTILLGCVIIILIIDTIFKKYILIIRTLPIMFLMAMLIAEIYSIINITYYNQHDYNAMILFGYGYILQIITTTLLLFAPPNN